MSTPLPVVFENAALLIVDKPAGWLSVPSRLGVRDARPCVGIQLQAQCGQQLWPVHRLDEEVSGLLLFAKTAAAHRTLSMAFEAHQIDKSYLALCEGSPPDAAQQGVTVRWETTLLRGKKRAYVHAAGKPAITDVCFLGGVAERPLFALSPKTGRGHQLRVELSRRGWPIVGDTLYGAPHALPSGGILLCACTLAFDRLAARQALGLPDRIQLPRAESPMDWAASSLPCVEPPCVDVVVICSPQKPVH